RAGEIVREHDGQGLPDEPHHVPGEHRPLERPLDVPGRRPRREVQVVGAEHGAHARHGRRRGGVDVLDPGMRHDGANEHGSERVRHRHVLDVPSAAGEEPRVLHAADDASEDRAGHAAHTLEEREMGGSGSRAGTLRTEESTRPSGGRGCLAALSLAATLLTLLAPPAPAIAAPRIAARRVAGGLNQPTAFTFGPGDRIWYLEKATGEVRVHDLRTGADRLFFRVPGVNPQGERGMLGIALHPDFPTRPFVYVYATRSVSAGLRNQVLRITDRNGTGASPKVLISVPASSSPYHNGGRILFGSDGMLYVVVGDAHDPANAQDTSDNLRGKILRMTPSGGVPSDNPFPRSPIFAFGIRNSFGFTFDPTTGRLWETENGPECNDELNLIATGRTRCCRSSGTRRRSRRPGSRSASGAAWARGAAARCSSAPTTRATSIACGWTRRGRAWQARRSSTTTPRGSSRWRSDRTVPCTLATSAGSIGSSGPRALPERSCPFGAPSPSRDCALPSKHEERASERSMGGDEVQIGQPKRIIEVEPATIPIPEVLPQPEPAPERVPSGPP